MDSNKLTLSDEEKKQALEGMTFGRSGDSDFALQRNSVLETDNPDDAAYDLRKAKELGVPRVAIAGDRDRFKRQDEVRTQQETRAKAPKFHDWLADPDNYAVGRDDADNMGIIEQVFSGFAKTPKAAAAAGGDIRRATGDRVGLFLADEDYKASKMLRDMEVNGFLYRARKTGEKYGYTSPEYKAVLEERHEIMAGGRFGDRLANAQETQGKFLENLVKLREIYQSERPETDGNIEGGIVGFADSGVRMLPGLLTGIATRNATAASAVMGGQVGLDERTEGRLEGLSIDDANQYGMIQGGIELATERLGLGALFGGEGKSMTKRFIQTMAREQIGEQIATHSQDFVSWQYLNPEKTLDDYISERPDAAVQTAISTFLLSGTMSGVALGAEAGLNELDKRAKRALMTEGDKSVADMLDAADKSALRTRSPEKFAEAIDRMVDGSDAETMTVDLDGLSQALEQAGVDPLEAAADFGVTAEELQQAFDMGGDFNVKTSALLKSKLARENRDALQPHIKQTEDDLTPAQRAKEIEAVNAEIEGSLDKLGETAKEALAREDQELQVREMIEEQIGATGIYTGTALDMQARGVEALISKLALDAGITPTEAMREYAPRIRGVIAGEVREADIDPAALEQAQSEGYEGADAGEAKEWLRAKAKGLDMSTEARMARAKEMGFDTETVLYHGTDAEFNSFSLGRVGSSQDGKLFYGNGIYFAENERSAGLYGDNVKPFFVSGKILNITSKDEAYKVFKDEPLTQFGGKTLAAMERDALSDANKLNVEEVIIEDGAGPALVRVSYKSKGKWFELDQQGPGGISRSFLDDDATGMRAVEYFTKPKDYASKFMHQVTPSEIERIAKKNNYSGVKGFGSIGMLGDEIVIFDPSNIRSVNAAFDPDFSDSANLLAQGGQNARGAFDPSRNEITLFEGANLSTLMHEAAHWYFDTLLRMEANGTIPPSLTKQLDEVFKWGGVDRAEAIYDENGKPTDVGRELHEKFAETFEVYLQTGKAPSAKLRDVFRAFKAWLTRLYAKLDPRKRAELTPEITAVFDRMLATDNQIEAATKEFTTNAEALAQSLLDRKIITKRQYENAVKRLDAAREKAKEDLMASLMADVERTEKAWWKTERDRVKGEVIRSFDRSPVGRAMAWLGEGVYKGDIAEDKVPTGEAVMYQAREAGYEGESRGEAVEWLRAVAKGLDMSQEARMARAREMGFDTETVLYHGTGASFDRFTRTPPTRSTTADSARTGIWITSSSKEAAEYGELGARNIKTSETQKLINAAEQRRDWGEVIRLRQEWEASNAAGFDGASVLPLLVRGNFRTVDLRGAKFSEASNDIWEAINAAQREGASGVRFNNIIDPANRSTQAVPTTHIVIFAPSNIRSVNAAFDPDFSDSANLLAQEGTMFSGSRQDRYREEAAAAAREKELQRQLEAEEISAAEYEEQMRQAGWLMQDYGGTPSEAAKKQVAAMLLENKKFKRWFGDSKVVDEDGLPVVVYHGAKKAGFSTFDTSGQGKTAGTGAFFTESNMGAFTYSGTENTVKPFDVKDVIANPDEYEIDIEQPDGPGTPFFVYRDGYEYSGDTAEDAVIDAFEGLEMSPSGAGNYPVYLSIKDPMIVDAEGANWDSIGGKEYFIEDADGETVEYFTNRQDAEDFLDDMDELGEIVESFDNPDRMSTDDLARMARDQGYDGLIVENVVDEGGFGQGYGWDNKIYVAFEPTQIKSVDNFGEFDPSNPSILFQSGGNPKGWGETVPPTDLSPMRLNLKAVRDGYGEAAVRKLPYAVRQRAVSGDAVSDMVAVVAEVAATLKAKPPKSLGDFIRSKSVNGIKIERTSEGETFDDDMAAEVRTALESMGKGYVNNRSGKSIDYVREAAQEAGYIFSQTDEFGRTDLNDFIDALNRESAGERVYRLEDQARAQSIADAETWRDWLLENGVDIYERDRRKLKKMVADFVTSSAENAVTPDQAADVFGFETGEDLLDAMAKIGSRGRFVNEEADRLMREEFGDPFNDGTLAEKARRIAENEVRARQAEIELAALQEALGKPAASNRAKEMARERLSMMTVAEIGRYRRFRDAEQRWMRAALEATEKGDMGDALLYKQRQLVNMHLFREGEKLSEVLDKRQRDLRKYETQKSRREKIAPEYLEKIDGLLGAYELRVSKQGPGEQKARQSAAQWVLEMTEAGREAEITAEAYLLAESADRKTWRSLTMDEVEYLKATIENLAHLGKTKQRLLADRDKRQFDAVITDLVDTLEAAGPLGGKLTPEPSREKSHRPTITEGISGALRTSHAWLMRPEHQFRALDGKDNGPLWNALFRAFADAADVESQMARDSAKAVRKAYSIYSSTERYYMHGKSISLPELGPAKGKRWTKMDVISMALNWGVQYNREALIEGYGWSMDQVQSVLDRVMTDKDWDFVEAIWEESGRYRDEAFALQKEMTGVEPKAVEGMDFTTPSGRKIEGKYYHLEYDSRQLGAASNRQKTQDDKEALHDRMKSFTRPMTRNGALKERVGSGGKPVKLNISVFERTVMSTIHDIAYRRAVIDVTRIVRDDRFRDAYQRTAGMEAYDQLMPWLESIATEKTDQVQGIASIMQTMRRNLPISYMGYKVGTAAIQVTGLLAALPDIGIRYVAQGAAKAFFGNPLSVIGAWQEVSKKSEFMRDRPMGYDRDIREVTSQMGAANPLSSMKRHAFVLISALDIVVSTPAWIGAYDKAMAGKADGIEAGNEDDAIAYADAMIRRTQTAGRAQDLARVSRDSELWRQVTMIFGYFSNLYGYTSQKVRAARSGEINPLDFMYFSAILFVAIPVLAELLSGRLLDDEDEDETIYSKSGDAVISNFAGMFPVMRDVVNYNLKPEYGYNLSPVASGMEDVAQTSTALMDAVFAGEEFTEADTKRAVRALGGIFGVPSSQLVITGDYIWDTMQGEEDPIEEPGRIFTEGLLRNTG